MRLRVFAQRLQPLPQYCVLWMDRKFSQGDGAICDQVNERQGFALGGEPSQFIRVSEGIAPAPVGKRHVDRKAAK